MAHDTSIAEYADHGPVGYKTHYACYKYCLICLLTTDLLVIINMAHVTSISECAADHGPIGYKKHGACYLYF